MLDRCVTTLTHCLVKADTISEDDYEIYEYGIRLFLLMVINVSITILLGFLFHMLVQSLLLLFCFAILRRYAGGYHARTAGVCVVLSTLMIGVGLWMIRDVTFAWQLSVGFAATLGIILIVFAPVPDRNRPLTPMEEKHFGSMAAVVYALETGMFGIGLVLHIEIVTRVMTSVDILLIVVIVAGVVYNKCRC